MTNDEFKHLIERYLEGDTTNGEEQRMALFLRQDSLPPEFMIYRQMFDKVSRPTRGVRGGMGKLTEKSEEPFAKHRIATFPWYLRVAGVAAVALLFFVAGYGLRGAQPASPSQTVAVNAVPIPTRERAHLVAEERIIHDTVRVTKVVIKKVEVPVALMANMQPREEAAQSKATSVQIGAEDDRLEIKENGAMLSLNILPY